jgi:tetratricopeptide (TPR) repeat protein
MNARRPTALAVVAVFLGACAGAKPRPDSKTLVFPPVTIVAGSAAERELSSLNDQELFAKGKAAFAASDYKLAAACFTRGADLYPQSPLHAALEYNAGLALMQLQEWGQALERFLPRADAARGKGDSLDAAFQSATCLYFLERYDEAAHILETIALRHDVPEALRLQAQVDEAVCLVEQNRLADAEHQLRDALRSYQTDRAEQVMPEDVAGKAEFFMGEIYRAYFTAIKLDPAGDLDQLGKDLESKAEELLSAQGHYLRAIRIGSPRWATASGYRIGALYEELYDAMIEAPIPHDLDADQKAFYREELKRRIRVLVTKSINIYDQTLAAASRIGEDNPFVAQTHQSLERMKRILLEDDATTGQGPASAASPPASAASPDVGR